MTDFPLSRLPTCLMIRFWSLPIGSNSGPSPWDPILALNRIQFWSLSQQDPILVPLSSDPILVPSLDWIQRLSLLTAVACFRGACFRMAQPIFAKEGLSLNRGLSQILWPSPYLPRKACPSIVACPKFYGPAHIFWPIPILHGTDQGEGTGHNIGQTIQYGTDQGEGTGHNQGAVPAFAVPFFIAPSFTAPSFTAPSFTAPSFTSFTVPSFAVPPFTH